MINILKKSSLTFLSLASILFAGTLTARAAIDINDSSSYYDTENWYAIRNGGAPTISSLNNSISISVFAFDSIAFCYFDSISLDVGQKITVSGTINLSGLYTGSKTSNTVISIADSRNFPQTTLDNLLSENGLGHGINSKKDSTSSSSGDTEDGSESGTADDSSNSSAAQTFSGSDITSSMAGFVFSPTTFYNRNKTTEGSMVVSTIAGGTTIEKDLTFSTPTAEIDYDFEISITKTAENTYSGSGSFNGEDAVLFENQENTLVSQFDVLAFRVPVGTGANYTTTISNLAISVIPEPSLFGLFAGTLALAFAGTRRRRK